MKAGEFIRQTRLTKGYSLREFANMVDVSPTYMSKIERGEFAPPSADKIIVIANKLGLNSDLLLAMAGKLSPELTEMILTHPAEISNLIRTVYNWKPEKIIQLTHLIQNQLDAKPA